MKLEQIIALTQAGFTKNDILAMCGQNQHMPVQSQHMPVQSQQMPVQSQHMPVQSQQMLVQSQQMPNGLYYGYTQNINQQSPHINEQNDVLSELKNLTRTVQSNNVNMMQNKMPKQVTTEDAIASIINPPNYEGLTDGGNK